MIQLKITSDSLDEVEAQLALIFTYQDIRPLRGQAGLVDWRLNGYLSKLLLKKRFHGELGEALLMPAQGRVAAQELLFLGLGAKEQMREQDIPQRIALVLDKVLRKKDTSLALSLSDLAQGMFEWRNTVRLFMSNLSGRKEEFKITLIEPKEFVEDAKRRHMDFSYDVQVQYR